MAEQARMLMPSPGRQTVTANWRAAIVLQNFIYDDSKQQLPPQAYDDKGKRRTILRRGERGVSVDSKLDPNSRLVFHLVCVQRFGVHFQVPVPQDHLVLGAIYRTTAEKISDLQALSQPQLNDTLRSWSMTGSALDRYVKALWISIRAQRSQLEFLGIDPRVAKFMFDWEFFIPNVDKVLRLLRDRFKNAMNIPNQTVDGLIAMCDKQSSTWPENGKGVIYARAYTHLDPAQTDANNTGLYVGWSLLAQNRHGAHLRGTKNRPARDTDRPSHYDVARRARHCHVLIALCLSDNETLTSGGTPEAQAMAEQTVMLMLKSYAPWVETWPDELDPYSQRARLLVKVEQRVRSDTGFQPNWKVTHGTNISSPIFELWGRRDRDSGHCSSLIQCTPILPPHPQRPGKIVMRATVHFHRAKISGVATRFSGPRVGDSRPTSPVMVFIPNEIADKIREAVEPTPSTAPFYATLAFEIMDGNHEHPRPYCGLPAVGPYHNFDAAKRLGIRVEWKHHSSDRWFSAPVQITPGRHSKIALALLKGDGKPLETLFQETTALINMAEGKECPNAPNGFWKYLTFRRNSPMIQKLEFDHLRQTVHWVVHIQTQVEPPTKTTFEENRRLLRKNRAPIMIVGKRLPKTDAFWYVDKSSANSVKSGGAVHCDTCRVLARRRIKPKNYGIPCEYDEATESCLTCTTLDRPCTFSPLGPLISGWVGKEVDPRDYLYKGNAVMFPMYGCGPLRRLVPHLGFSPDELKVTEIAKLIGWTSLYPFLESNEDEEEETVYEEDEVDVEADHEAEEGEE